MQIPEQLRIAIDNYLAGIATPEEKQLVNEWYRSFNDDEVELPLELAEVWPRIKENMRAGILESIQLHDKQEKSVKIRHLSIYRRVAVASIALLVGSYFYFSPGMGSSDPEKNTAQKKTPLHDVPPGGNKAVLTLADGSNIVLDSAANGVIRKQGAANVFKTADGKLAYNAGQQEASQTVYNSITTPPGGEYELQLSDGSKVWLNAASSLRFPTTFNGKERHVELSGEAYFEVAHNAEMPFKVMTYGMEVQVLGTQFNINAYSNENSIKTTLLKGAVKVIKDDKSLLLAPGQQVRLEKDGQMKMVQKFNMDVVTAWKNGRFEFEDNTIESVMRQIQRWYNVEVVYEGGLPDIRLTGAISRYENVSRVLTMLELTSMVHFTMEGNIIKVSK